MDDFKVSISFLQMEWEQKADAVWLSQSQLKEDVIRSSNLQELHKTVITGAHSPCLHRVNHHYVFFWSLQKEKLQMLREWGQT